MSKSQVFRPFPPILDRQFFGAWLSGFTDGEGSFILPYTCNSKRGNHYTPSARFTINLRSDDAEILYIIQSFWGCGRVKLNGLTDKRNPNPHMVFNVHDLASLQGIVVPHFDAFPLLAKKSRDFVIWKQAVALLHGISLRPRTWIRKPGGNRGFIPKWVEKETKEFLAFREALQKQRLYTPPQ